MNYELHAIEATSGQMVAYLKNANLDIEVSPSMQDSVTFSSTLTEEVALTNAGQWAFGIAYLPTRQ
jgi:molybdopterin-guanine dinucleotide biosynthesis protein